MPHKHSEHERNHGSDIPNGAGSAEGSASTQALLDDVLAEVRRMRVSRSAEATGVAARGKRLPPGRGVAGGRPARPATSWGQIAAIVAGFVLVTAAGYLAIRYVRSDLREQTALAALRRADSGLKFLESALRSADDLRAARDYPGAMRAYETVVNRANSLLKRLQDDTGNLPPSQLKDQADDVIAKITERLQTAKAGLNAPEVRGLVEFDGKWVTPEEKEKLFAEKMNAEGRQIYQGKWLTEDEIHAAKGEVRYEGRWVTPAEYARLLAAAQRQPRPGSPDVQPTPPEPPGPARRPEDLSPAAPQWTLDDFEAPVHRWTNAPWRSNDANPCGLSTVTGSATGRLKLALKPGQSDKSAIVRPIGLNFTSRSRLVLDIYNDCGEPIRIAIALQADEYYESRGQWLKIGENKNVRFDLLAGDFKCLSQGEFRNFKAHIRRRELVTHLYILIYFEGAGEVFLDNIAALGGG